MHSTGSHLLSVLERIRVALDLSTSKYTNDLLLREFIPPAEEAVWSRLNLNRKDPVTLRLDISITDGQEYYVLPPNVQEIWGLQQFDDEGNLTRDFRPRSNRSPRGPGWSIQGNMLRVWPLPPQDETWTITYVPTGDFKSHYSTGGATLAGGTVFALDQTPDYGDYDYRESAYIGGYLRVFGSDFHEVRVIKTHDEQTGAITLYRPLSLTTFPDTGISYEVTTMVGEAMVSAVAYAAIMELAVIEDVSEKKYRGFRNTYRTHLKTVGDRAANVQMRIPTHWEKNTMDQGQNEFPMMS